jgi:hypothetical protein
MVIHRHRPFRARWLWLGLTLSAFVGLGLGGEMIASSAGDGQDDSARAGLLRPDVLVNVERAPGRRRVSAGFVGLSLEYPAVTVYAGSNR